MKTVKIWKAPKGVEARYVTVTEKGQLIRAYRKLSDIRKDYCFEIRHNMIGLKRELDHVWPRETEKTEEIDMSVYSWKQWRKDGEFKAEPRQEISLEVYDIMRRCAEPLPLTAAEYGMEAGFVMGQDTGSRDGKPLHMAKAAAYGFWREGRTLLLSWRGCVLEMKVSGLEYPAVALVLWYFYIWFLYGIVIIKTNPTARQMIH